MDCSKLAVIPLYAGTCWFNAILIVSLYSQYTRKAVIKDKDGNIKFDVNKFRFIKIIPCPLMKFNWNIHKDTKFNLNSKLCKLDFIKKDNDNLCYSFNKGRRTFIYAKVSNKKIKNTFK